MTSGIFGNKINFMTNENLLDLISLREGCFYFQKANFWMLGVVVYYYQVVFATWKLHQLLVFSMLFWLVVSIFITDAAHFLPIAQYYGTMLGQNSAGFALLNSEMTFVNSFKHILPRL